MALSKNELIEEKRYLDCASSVISQKLDDLGKEISVKQEELTEFRKVLWEDKGSIDKVEMTTGLMSSEFEAGFMLMKMDYYKKLLKLKYSPYFGRIDFKEKDTDKIYKVYIGLAGVEKDLNYIIYDWRSPIAGMFYDYGIGSCKYESPDGDILGSILLRRQYKIENNKIIRAFDSDLNVVDEMLQEVLDENSSDKMKNIVNTIQKEQNEIIRNVHDKNLIVQGIAGSGKTSVALHRIAFLLYKIKNLKSANVVIFSPNNVFSEYISDVLPELGEDNTSETTFKDFAQSFIKEFKETESFTTFIERYYTKKDDDVSFTTFKLSDEMIDVIENYVKEIENNIKITSDIEIKTDTIDKEYLNYILKERFNRLPLFSRIEKMAEHLCDKYGLSYGKNKKSFIKLIKDNLNIKPNYVKIYKDLYLSNSFKEKYCGVKEIKLNKKIINYDDSLCFIYLKGLLTGFPYSNLIKQVVIDEAQDYNMVQYKIICNIFKRASFTILGDVNQTINPYYKYDTLSKIGDILNDKSKYVELNKTYRSSPNIISYANKVLNLKHVSAIRNSNNIPVQYRGDISYLKNDVNNLKKKYKSVAIITKDEEESIKIYNYLKDDVKDISLMKDSSLDFNKNLVVVPSYLSKGLEFDSVISYTDMNNKYTKDERYLFYVVVTRSQHELIIYNAPFTI
ncbi:MAG TPA: AAA family ATPase [Candidatus Aphodocola excrementigallinarum]|uniref:AAA family ATPase n=1 Tax=Candidatus Aphodocola excrementigallinarum TaxID=2840670 RepID=A0A9D1LJ24_9FIRM|nr:AAA family ATPase [Candidatus Aphodocola excrementigallinarum]